MRAEYVEELYKQMEQNKDIWCICLDLGYGAFDKIRDDFPDRYLNPGAAEQAGMDIAVGLALEGKIPFVYSITTFLLYRPFETLRTYINHEKIPVKLVANGRDRDYAHDGISHWSEDAKHILATMPNIHTYFPHTATEGKAHISHMVQSTHPDFISLKR
jgi:transketolase